MFSLKLVFPALRQNPPEDSLQGLLSLASVSSSSWWIVVNGLCHRVAPSHTCDCTVRLWAQWGLCGFPAPSQVLETSTLPGCPPLHPARKLSRQQAGQSQGSPCFLRDHWPSLLMSSVLKNIPLRISSGFLGGVCKVGKGSFRIRCVDQLSA